jgi:hypothetical protein
MARRAAQLQLTATARSHPELVAHLRAQLGFLRRSATAYDSGADDEAVRLAQALRVLLHDTTASRSLLRQLNAKDRLRFPDSASPIRPRNLVTTPGLVGLEIGPQGARYHPFLDNGLPDHYGVFRPFEEWWTRPVTQVMDGRTLSRRTYVLVIADKEGGAHVDPESDPMYAALTRDNALGFEQEGPDGSRRPLDNNPAFACVRQIAWEAEQAIVELLSAMPA